MLAKLNEKQKLLTILGAGVLLSSLGGGGVWWAKGLVEEEQKAIAAKKVKMAEAQQKIDKIPATEKEVIVLRENLDEYVKILPDLTEVEKFVDEVWQYERQSGISIDSFKPARTRNARGNRFSKVEYQFELTGTLWQVMQFMSFVENHKRFIKITAFKLQSGGAKATRAEDAEKVNVEHEVKMTLETYVYEKPKGGSEVLIANYTNKRDALAEEIFQRQQKISIERYEYKGDMGRRDIFTDPRMSGEDNEGVVPLEQQSRILEQFVGIASELQAMYERANDETDVVLNQYALRKEVREKLAVTLSKMQEVEDQGLISYMPFESRWKKEVRQPLAELQRVISEGGGAREDQYLDEKTFKQLISGMKDDLETGRLEQARSSYDSVRTKVNVPPDDPRFQYAVTALHLYKRANVGIEFGKKKLDIEGVMVNQVGPSGVLLNGQVYEEGEYIAEDLFVKEVQKEQIAFVYQGFVLIKTF